MKRTFFGSVISLGVILTLVMLVSGCGGGGPAGIVTGSLLGSVWKSTEGAEGGSTLTFTGETEWAEDFIDDTGRKGTYTYSGNVVSFTVTHEKSVPGGGFALLPTEKTWKGTIFGNTMVTEGKSYGKDGAPLENPWYGTVWTSSGGGAGLELLTIMNAAEWQETFFDGTARKGTYVYEGNLITFTVTWEKTVPGSEEFTPVLPAEEWEGTVTGNSMVTGEKTYTKAADLPHQAENS